MIRKRLQFSCNHLEAVLKSHDRFELFKTGHYRRKNNNKKKKIEKNSNTPITTL